MEPLHPSKGTACVEPTQPCSWPRKANKLLSGITSEDHLLAGHPMLSGDNRCGATQISGCPPLPLIPHHLIKPPTGLQSHPGYHGAE